MYISRADLLMLGIIALPFVLYGMVWLVDRHRTIRRNLRYMREKEESLARRRLLSEGLDSHTDQHG